MERREWVDTDGMEIIELDAAHVRRCIADRPPETPSGPPVRADPDTPSNLEAMVALAVRAHPLLMVVAPDAPGLFFLGGTVHHRGRRVSVTGTGSTFEDAVVRLGGEVGEFQALEGMTAAARTIDAAELLRGWPAPWRRWLIDALGPGARTRERRTVAVLDGVTIDDRAPLFFPLEVLWRQGDLAGLVGPRVGCAAAATAERARASALLELVEREAALLWWRGGLRPTRLRFTGAARERVEAYRGELRRQETGRVDRLFSLGQTFGAVTVAAVSFDRDGTGFACGTAARVDAEEATMAALRELCQMEAGLRMSRFKRNVLGERALSDADRRILARARAVRADDVGLRGPAATIGPATTTTAGVEGERIARVARQLRASGCLPIALDMPTPLRSCCVAKVVVPGLQPSGRYRRTGRLSRIMAQTGGGIGVRRRCALY